MNNVATFKTFKVFVIQIVMQSKSEKSIDGEFFRMEEVLVSGFNFGVNFD